MSTLRVGTISNSGGTASVPSDTVISGSAKAWVNFNGTGTVAIRAQFNVSSITDNNVGEYTVNFTTAMPDANYAVFYTSGSGNDDGRRFVISPAEIPPTTSSVRAVTKDDAGTRQDYEFNSVAIFR